MEKLFLRRNHSRLEVDCSIGSCCMVAGNKTGRIETRWVEIAGNGCYPLHQFSANYRSMVDGLAILATPILLLETNPLKKLLYLLGVSSERSDGIPNSYAALAFETFCSLRVGGLQMQPFA